jgi:hypothetical protein
MKIPGPDGKYLRGKPLEKGDRGGLYSTFKVFQNDGVCVLQFGPVVQWVGMLPEEAIGIAGTFRSEIRKAFGHLSYDPATFPLKVEADQEMNVVKTTLPIPTAALVANPEVFLVWADELDKAVKELWKTRN